MCPREKGFVLWGHCQNLLDDPRIMFHKHHFYFDMLEYFEINLTHNIFTIACLFFDSFAMNFFVGRLKSAYSFHF